MRAALDGPLAPYVLQDDEPRILFARTEPAARDAACFWRGWSAACAGMVDLLAELAELEPDEAGALAEVIRYRFFGTRREDDHAGDDLRADAAAAMVRLREQFRVEGVIR